MSLPVIRVRKAHASAIAGGVPWIMRHQAVESSEWMAAPPGLARVEGERGEPIGIGLTNPNSHIVCRMLSWRQEPVDQAFFLRLFSQALKKRAHYEAPCYRLAHGEADGLPGLIIDRFDEVLVIQVASAGMERLQPLWLGALEALLSPGAILLRNDFSARKLEGLSQGVVCLKGTVPERVRLEENSCHYFADLWHGQKTGWFYDMRDNRSMVAKLAKDKTMLDVFSHSGGFGVLAARQGAAEVTMVDSSQSALGLAMRAADENGVAARCKTLQGDAIKTMTALAGEGRHYDIVVADPPAYVKSSKDVAAGLKGYEKVAAAASALVAPGGFLFTASCSHHAKRGAFNKAALSGVEKTGRAATIIKQTGAGGDHPLHPHLPQGEYLKGLLLQLD